MSAGRHRAPRRRRSVRGCWPGPKPLAPKPLSRHGIHLVPVVRISVYTVTFLVGVVLTFGVEVPDEGHYTPVVMAEPVVHLCEVSR